jgi:hypothetical protein
VLKLESVVLRSLLKIQVKLEMCQSLFFWACPDRFPVLPFEFRPSPPMQRKSTCAPGGARASGGGACERGRSVCRRPPINAAKLHAWLQARMPDEVFIIHMLWS